jgi:alanine racemase
MYHDAIKLEISRGNLLHNYRYLRKSSQKELIPVLKSNAYGFGINLIARVLYEEGQRFFSVARYSEALEILAELSNCKDVKVLVFESVQDLELIQKNKNIIFSINSMHLLAYLIQNCIDPHTVQIKLDLGFTRNGIPSEDWHRLRQFLKEKNLFFSGIYSHLFSANEKTCNMMTKKFDTIISMLGRERFCKIHLNSSESFYYEKYAGATDIRIGQLLYGIEECEHPDRNLKKIFSLNGAIDYIKNIQNNNYIGYEHQKNSGAFLYPNVAIVKFGYGDGFLKENINTTCRINDREYPIIGISMGHTYINVDDKVKIGDISAFYYDPNDLFQKFGRKIYEFTTILNEKIKREIVE